MDKNKIQIEFYEKFLELKNTLSLEKEYTEAVKLETINLIVSFEDWVLTQLVTDTWHGYNSKEKIKYEYNFEPETSLLKYFPLTKQAEILNRFVGHAYRYAWGPDLEIGKLVYLLWNNYDLRDYKSKPKVYPHNDIYEALYTIKSELKTMKDLDNEKQRALYSKFPEKSGFYNWHLLGFLPLLDDDGLIILRNIIKQCYSNAQDMLMFGLYQYDPKSFYLELKSIMLYWHTNNNIQFSSGTGIIGQLDLIVKKYKEHSIDVENDPDLKCIFTENS
jgi:hypothetical protein